MVCPTLLFWEVSAVLFVFRADVFPDFAVRNQIQGVLDAEGPGVHFGIVDGHLDVHVAEIPPPVTFLNTEGLTTRMTSSVQPAFIVETDCIGHQRITVPLAHRIPHPGWLRIGGMLAAIRK